MTKFNYTVFVRTVSPAALQAAIYSRLARAGRIRPDASILSRERVRVVQELGRSSRQLAALKALEAYAKGRPPSLAAEVANVWAMTSDDIWTRIHANYVPRNSVLIVAGDIDLDDTAHVIGQAADALGLVAPTDITRSPRVARPAFNQPPLVIHQNDPGTFSVALGYPQPDHQSSDFPAFMVLDQLLLSERDGDPQPGATASTDRSAFATRLSARIHAFDLWDGKEAHWGAPLFSDGNPSLYTIIFSLHDLRSTEEVRAAALATLRDIRLHALSNAEIETAKSRLSAYYGQWLLEPSFRIVSDHLAALAAAGRNPEEVNDVQRQIMAVRPAAVRRMMDALIARAPLFVLLAPRA